MTFNVMQNINHKSDINALSGKIRTIPECKSLLDSNIIPFHSSIMFNRNANKNNVSPNAFNKFNSKSLNFNKNASDFLQEDGFYDESQIQEKKIIEEKISDTFLETPTAKTSARMSPTAKTSARKSPSAKASTRDRKTTHSAPNPFDTLGLESNNPQLQELRLLQNNSNEFAGGTYSKLAVLSQTHFSQGLPDLEVSDVQERRHIYTSKKTPRYVERKRNLISASIFTLIMIFFNAAIIANSFLHHTCPLLMIYVIVGGLLNIFLVLFEWSIVWCCIDSKQSISPVRRYDRIKIISSVVMFCIYIVAILWLCTGSAFITMKFSHKSCEKFNVQVIVYHVMTILVILGRIFAFCGGKFCSGICFKLNIHTKKVGLPLVPIIHRHPMDSILPPIRNNLQLSQKKENISSNLELKPMDPLGHSSILWQTLYAQEPNALGRLTSFTRPGLPMAPL